MRGTARYRSPNPSLSLFLFSLAISAFVRGEGLIVSWCVVLGGSGRIRFGFLRQTVLLFFSFSLSSFFLIQPNITSILDHFFVEF